MGSKTLLKIGLSGKLIPTGSQYYQLTSGWVSCTHGTPTSPFLFFVFFWSPLSGSQIGHYVADRYLSVCVAVTVAYVDDGLVLEVSELLESCTMILCCRRRVFPDSSLCETHVTAWMWVHCGRQLRH